MCINIPSEILQAENSVCYWVYLLNSWIAHFDGKKAKGQISKWLFQENKSNQKFQKMNISYTLICTRHVHVHVKGVRNVHFSENLACFVFLKHPFWDSPFCLITVDFSGLDWMTHDMYFTILLEVFMSHILAKSTYYTNHIEWPENKATVLKPAYKY